MASTVIWRKAFYNTKGFGFTLRGNDDFKLQQFRAGSAAYLETYYGEKNDGDVTDPKNLRCILCDVFVCTICNILAHLKRT